jgi:hypothetical protein
MMMSLVVHSRGGFSMLFLQCTVDLPHPRWDGGRVLFDVLFAGKQAPCAISRMALEDIAERHVRGTAELLSCFANARARIEGISLKKLQARPDGVSGRLNLWLEDVDDPPPEGAAGAAHLQAAWLRSA